jgi:molecular chaperone IbpA
MTTITALDLTPFYRNTIGMDRLFDRIVNQFDHASSTNYPPYDIVKVSEDSYEIRVAVAGFSQGEIDVTFHEGQLVITGEKSAEENVNYLHHGISARKFTRSFQLAEYVEIKTAVAQDGILTVKLDRVLPEAAKPKTIAITYVS